MFRAGDLVMITSVEDRQGKTKVTSVTDKLIWIEAPSEVATMRTFLLQEEETVSLYFFKEHGAMYAFETRVKERRNDPLRGQGYGLSMPKESEISRVQRRQFVRVESALDVAVHPHKKTFLPYTTVSLDLSAGGIRILSDRRPVEVGEELELTFILPQNEGWQTIDVVAELVRSAPRDEKYELSFQFTQIPDRSRELVLRHCYQAQMKNTGRGTNPFTSP